MSTWIRNLGDLFFSTATSALGAGFRALRDPAGFVRDDLPPEADDLTRWIQDRNRRACRRHARNEAAGAYSTLGELRRPRYAHCLPYLDSINEGPETTGKYGPPFTGGQCPIAYNIAYSGVAISNPNAQGQGGGEVLNFTGQSQGFNKYPVGPITGISIGGSNPAECGTASGKQIKVQTATGVVGFGCFPQANQPSGFDPKSVQFTAITPANSNQSDNCGDPPNRYEPPGWPKDLPVLPPPEVPPPGGDGDDDIDVDDDGNWRICENGDCTNPYPPGGGGGPDRGGGPGEPDGEPQTTNPNDPNNPNEVSGCVEEGNILTGVKIDVTTFPPNYQGLGDIFYRSCWVWLGPSSDLLDMVVDGRTLESGQFVIPDSRDCTCFKVRANPGFRVSVQPYSRPKEE